MKTVHENLIKDSTVVKSTNSFELGGGTTKSRKEIITKSSQNIEQRYSQNEGKEMVNLAYDLTQYKELTRPTTINPEIASFSDLENWMQFEDRKSTGTIKHTLSYLKAMELHPKVPIDLKHIDPHQIVIHFRYREQIEKVSPNVIRNNLKAIRLYFRACGLDPKIIRYKPPDIPETSNVKVPKPEIVNSLIYHEYSTDPYTNALIQYLLCHNFIIGWRVPSEPCILSIDDIDLESGYITITEPKKRQRRRHIIPEENILTSRRHKSFKNWIDCWIPKVANQYSKNLLYLKPDGRPFTPDTLRMFLYRHVLPIWSGYRPYISRHWCAVARLLEWDLKTIRVKDWLGHQKIDTTMTYLNTAQMFYDKNEKNWINRALRKHKRVFVDSSINQEQKISTGKNQSTVILTNFDLNPSEEGVRTWRDSNPRSAA